MRGWGIEENQKSKGLGLLRYLVRPARCLQIGMRAKVDLADL